MILGRDSPKGTVDEADVPAQPNSPSAKAWLSSPNEDPRRSRDLEAASCQGTPAARSNRLLEVVVSIPTGSFKRVDRLLRRQEFRYVTRYGQSARVGSFVMLAASRETNEGDGRTRLGITVSRRVGNAITRNRVKRRIREWFRHQRLQMEAGVDIVVIARQTAAEISQHETIRVLNKGIRAVGVLA